jgi:thioredoxin 1
MNSNNTQQTTNNNTKTLIAVILGLALITGGVLAYSTLQKVNSEKTKNDEAAMIMKKKTDDSAAMKNTEDAVMKKDGDTMKKDEKSAAIPVDVMKKAGIYTAYSADLAKSAAVDGNSVIFFHAPWCPTCKAAETDINANLTKLDSKLTLLKTDYDTSTELKKQYGVTSQSTFVKVDKDGKLIKKGSGFTTVDSINAFANN